MTTQDTLLSLMNLPPSRFSGVCRTADGYYMASAHGDVGYNHFLGKPSPPHDGPGRDLMLKVWHELTETERLVVVHLANHPIDGTPIRLAEDFGVPVKED